jgi:hypothetical protein
MQPDIRNIFSLKFVRMRERQAHMNKVLSPGSSHRNFFHSVVRGLPLTTTLNEILVEKVMVEIDTDRGSKLNRPH